MASCFDQYTMGLIVKRWALIVFCWLLPVAEGVTISFKRKQKDSYYEKLSLHRVVFKKEKAKKVSEEEDGSIYEISQQLDELFNKLKGAHQRSGKVEGYTLQVYGGANRSVANGVQQRLLMEYPDSYPVMDYMPPLYRVRVGFILEKLEAYPFYLVVKKLFPSVIIRPFFFTQEAYQDYRTRSADPTK